MCHGATADLVEEFELVRHHRPSPPAAAPPATGGGPAAPGTLILPKARGHGELKVEAQEAAVLVTVLPDTAGRLCRKAPHAPHAPHAASSQKAEISGRACKRMGLSEGRASFGAP